MAIVVSGAAVRLTGSGMGCPTWPTCEDGSLVPRGATGANGWIEFLNRVFTGLVSVAVALAVLGARRRVPYRPELTRWAWGLVAGVFAQALLGGLVVVLHVAPLAVAGHYLLSAVLVAERGGPPPQGRRARRGRGAAASPPRRCCAAPARSSAWRGWCCVTGTLVTGSGPAQRRRGGRPAAVRGGDRGPHPQRRRCGCSSWRSSSCCAGRRSGDADPSTIGRGRVLVGAIVAQGALGYVQYAAGVPEALVAAHVLGSVLVWVAALRFHLALTAAACPPSAPTSRAPVVGAVAAAPS